MILPKKIHQGMMTSKLCPCTQMKNFFFLNPEEKKKYGKLLSSTAEKVENCAQL